MKYKMPKYKMPKKYLPWNSFEDDVELIQKYRPKEIDIYGSPSPLNNLSFLLHEWERGYPVYCVRESLLEDMLATDVAENLSLFDDIQLNVPSYILFFTTNTLKSPIRGYVNYVIVRHNEINSPEHKHLISWGGLDSSQQAFLAYRKIRRDGTLHHSAFVTQDQTTIDAALELRNIVLQSILLLQYYPELGEELIEAFEHKKKGFGSLEPKSEFLLPRWLGEQRKNYVRGTATGTGTPKRPHFRRGHWRVVGDRKVRVRPAWVNKQD